MGDESQYSNLSRIDEDEQPNWDEIFKPRAQPPLSEEQIAYVEKQKALFMEHMPEFYPFFHEASKLGLTDGWRSVRVTVIKKSESENEH